MFRDPKERRNSQGATISTQNRQRRHSSGDEAREAKRKLEELFGGKKSTPANNASERHPSASPRRSSGKVFSSPRKSTGRTPSDYRLRLERLRMAREPEEIESATNFFLERHQLPDEVDILFKVLQHPSEKVIREALGQLSSLIMQGRLSTTLMLLDRLNELSIRVAEEATHSYIEGLRSQVEALRDEG